VLNFHDQEKYKMTKSQPIKITGQDGMLGRLVTASAPAELKARAEDFLRNGVTGHSIKELQRAYNGLLAAQTILGPVHRDFRNSLESARKTLVDFQKIATKRELMLDICREELAPEFKKCLDIFKQLASSEIWAEAEPILVDMWERMKGEVKS
jgi:hypothetical protein